MCNLRKIVVFTGLDVTASTMETVEAILSEFPNFELLIVQGGKRRFIKRYVRGKLKRLLKQPISYPAELLFERIQRLNLSKKFKPKGRVEQLSLAHLDSRRVKILKFPLIHGQECLRAVKKFDPWLGISLSAPILYEKLFSIPVRGTINLHKSLLPEYRGMPPGFWELHDGISETGVSVHWMERGLDTGSIVEQQSHSIKPYASIDGLRTELDELGKEVLLKAIHSLDKGTERCVKQSEPITPTRSRPAFFTYLRIKKKLDKARKVSSEALFDRIRKGLKILSLIIFVYAWSPLRNSLRGYRGKCHATVLLFHRVDDGFLDSVSVGLGQFGDQIRFLSQKYEIIDLATFIRERGKPRTRPIVVITFDDGYADNYLAAKLLRREGIPATFFISTRIVNSDRPFPHDQLKLKRRIPALTWADVLEMQSWGFTFGNHTCNHVDVASLPLDDAMTEIRQASNDLLEHVGECRSRNWFAFPYGGRKNMTDEVLSNLSSLNVECCLSAYGGVNPPEFDSMNVLRQGIDFNFSKLALHACVEGWKTRC